MFSHPMWVQVFQLALAFDKMKSCRHKRGGLHVFPSHVGASFQLALPRHDEILSPQGEEEVVFFVSSLPVSVKRLAKHLRGHWGIENSLHWGARGPAEDPALPVLAVLQSSARLARLSCFAT